MATINASLTASNIPVVRLDCLDQDDTCTYTYARVISEDGRFIGSGFSKRNPTDPKNPWLGKRLAISRAVSNYVTAYYGSMRIIDVAKMLNRPAVTAAITGENF